jgi:hypothetical protein
MWVLDVKEMESPSKIDLKDVSWWMSIKDACKIGVPIIAILSKIMCISLGVRCRNPSFGLKTKVRAYKGAGQEGSP